MGSVAAQVAAWQRRARNRPGPLGPTTAGTGESPSGAPLQVELFVRGVWADITSFVMTRNGSFKVAITRGQPDQAQQTNPATCHFQLNNRDGRFSPRNPLGPYFGWLGRNQPLRVSVQSGNDKSYRFWGEVPAWPQQWDTTGTDVWVEVEAAGLLRRLGQGTAPLKSPVYRDLTNPSRLAIVAYWPCEDLAGSTSIASGLGGPAMTIAGTPSLAAFSAWGGSAPIPTMGTASFSGRVPTYSVTGETSTRCFVNIPSAGVSSNQRVVSLFASGTIARWDVLVNTSGGFAVRSFDSSGNNLSDSGFISFGTINGIQIMLVLELTQSGADATWRLVALNITTATFGSISGGSTGGTVAGKTIGEVSSIQIAADAGMAGVAIGQISIANAINAYAGSLDSLIGWSGEGPSDRMTRLCREEIVSFDLVSDGQSGNQVTLGTQGIDTLVNLLIQAATADAGIFHEASGALGLAYRTRPSLYNQNAALALSYTAFNLSEVPTPVDDDRFTRNDITATRTGGSSARATLSSGPMSTAQPPVGVGFYNQSITLNIQLDSDLPIHAGWRLHLGTVDEARYPTISVNLAHPSFVANPTLRQQVLALRPGDRLTISNPPAWLPPDVISQLVVGFSETIDHFEHRLTFNCVPESPYHTAILGDAVLGRLDTGGSQLTADAQPTDTTLSVATTSGPLWTTTDTPFDVRISGEQITVTGVTGVTSPQTFTCVRSVNGVVKLLPAGSDVRLNQPMILAL